MAMPPIAEVDITRILAAGGGLRIEAEGRSADDLARFAKAASNTPARLEIILTGPVATDDLVRISEAGKGAVLFIWPQGQLIQSASIS